ncbi:hypothetical protein PMM47T1_08751 [Pseudomonas sp. M47T1]|uniref:hypothetical protein n=1 Tax=unclassified Pseudomonas TaxID=196821 RepID=UPI0002607FCE|nr:hypothetical protein [Pseudomonas sp. M47T1]EIK97218.1 hypothetical protein PMM47T1_08751 [Pseudomonas sp. M47T1]
MRLPLLPLLTALCLAGCATPNAPSKTFTSTKSPEEVGACIYPKWQALRVGTDKSGSQKHMRLTVSSKMAADEILDIYKTQTGSEVSWYQREPLTFGRGELNRAVRECL